MNRRYFLQTIAAFAAESAAISRVQDSPKASRLVLVHGRDQQGQNRNLLRENWLKALNMGLSPLKMEIPSSLDVSFPFYGDRLAALVREFDIPLASEIHSKGGPEQDEFLIFQASVADELRIKAQISDAEVNAEYGDDPKEKGPLNWKWVQAILRALDKHSDGMGQKAIESFTRDVFLYISRPGIRSEIDGIINAHLTAEPTVIIGHSLGSVVAYSVLRSRAHEANVPLYLTLGSPLGIRAIRERFAPLKHPSGVKKWYNAYDKRDVVALNPLDSRNFPINPEVENYAAINNQTPDRHGIAGYLDKKVVSERLASELAFKGS